METSQIRWWDTLFFRGAMIVNVLMAVVFVVFALVEYQAERQRAVTTLHARLTEEARVLRVAHAQLSSPHDFQHFIDDYCHQMGPTASPGHHIIVVDTGGSIVTRAHDRADDDLEAAMIAHVDGSQLVLDVNGQPFLAAITDFADGERLVIAQSMDSISSALAATRNRTVAITSVLVIIVFAGSTIAFRHWVRRPLAELCGSVASIGSRDFGARAPVRGSGEIKFLAKSINDMADRLHVYDRVQQSAMRRARDIQRSLLPKQLPNQPTLEFAEFFEPTESIGGDIFDVLELADGRIMVAIFDVSGHGIPAALNTALLRTAFRQCARSGKNLQKIAHEINRELVEIGYAGEFATSLLLCIDADSERFSVISAGHDPPIVLRQSGHIEHLDCGGLPLGVVESSSYEAAYATLAVGDRVYLFTDGVHEVFDQNDQFFGRENLQRAIEHTAKATLQDQVNAIINSVIAFQQSSAFPDDVTFFAFERK
ncbi:MAG: SpoIIE family protein phosphatase [Phycisphaerae bacterium]|nr:SpoIIE family protein phosphatase [Phycisphaerales bacterium]